MKRARPFLVLLVTAMLAGLALVGPQATPAQAAVDVYVTPGYHTVNERQWFTACEVYSTGERCTSKIWSTQVTYTDGVYAETTGWFFNNLTYHKISRATWGSNPLANAGTWIASDGRQWRTECNTAVTGANGCRTYVTATKPVVKTVTPRTYATETLEVFNNMVRLPAVPVPEPVRVCNNAPLPPGFAITDEGLPHSTKPPYTPIDLYNPTAIAGFIRTVTKKIRDLQDPASSIYIADANQRAKAVADQTCLATTAGGHLVTGSQVKQYRGDTVRWYPYLFDFPANPSTEFDVLPGNPGWYSGLAQGSVLGALSELHLLTGDEEWMVFGDQTFESFMVPLADGGITNRENGFLWFEEYPTTPVPTTVLNGHMEALIGLDIWYRNRQEPRAKALFDEAVADLEPFLAMSGVQVDGGLATSYDLVRGYPSGALRFRPDAGGASVTAATFNGDDVTLPVGSGGSRGPNHVRHSDMNFIDFSGKDPDTWAVLNAATGGGDDVAYFAGVGEERGVRIRTSTKGWRGVQQFVPNFAPGEMLTLSFDSRLGYVDATKRGVAGKVAVYAACGTGTTLLYESQRTRSATWDTYNHTFRAPADQTCRLQVQLVSASWGTSNTYVWYDDVQLTTAVPRGNAFQPEFHLPDNLLVYKEPVTKVGVTGTGSGYLQVHADGVWEDITERVTLNPLAAQELVVPERYTGRNIHLAYHENHIDELISMCWRSRQQFFADYAKAWKPMAPAHNGTVIPQCAPALRTTAQSVEQPDLRYYDIHPPTADMDLTDE